jgi:DNA-binding LytR/AlgR family response regulator
MKEFINKIFSNQQVTIEELSKFIVEYSELCGIKNTTAQHIQFAIQFIQNGMFDLKYACKNCANKLGLQVVEMKDKNGMILYTKIQE